MQDNNKEKDLAPAGDIALGFFSTPIIEENDPETDAPQPNAPQMQRSKRRPRNNAEYKSARFSISMDPFLYERTRIIAGDICRGNVSTLIDIALKYYYEQHDINLDEIDVTDTVKKLYKK